MPAAPLVCMKLTTADNPAALEAEMMRKCNTYRNNVDITRSNLNITWQRNGLSFEAALEQRISELNLKRNLRSDAVKAEGFVISCNQFSMKHEDALAFLQAANKWFDERYGEENTISWAIHFDEGVPHLHRWQVPVITGKEGEYDRVSAKELFSPEKLKKLQRDFYDNVSSQFGYDRPLTKEERKNFGIGYAGLPALKAKTEAREAAAELEQLQSDVNIKRQSLENLSEISDRITSEISDLKQEKEALTNEINELKEQKSFLERSIEKLHQIAERIINSLPDPLAALVNHFRNNDEEAIDSWFESVFDSAKEMAISAPKKESLAEKMARSTAASESFNVNKKQNNRHLDDLFI